MSASFVLPTVVLPDSESSMPSTLLLETAYLEQLGLDPTLCSVYRSIEWVMREMEGKVGSLDSISKLQPLQKRLVDIETNHKTDGIWGGRLQDGNIPAGQATLNELLERAHALESEIVQRS